ncbi:MAG: hypothetical protein EOP88_00510 [Verrucomicrobiaceae bacterium]|nr:MAG: hypothetical protein EOP88_00510 [Verrucomicrobiaceae bacterium]
MKPIPTLLTVALLSASCGSNEAKLRSELESVDAELLHVSLAAEQHQAAMNEAEAGVYLGSFAAGYGATAGDINLAGEGIDTALQSTNRYETSSRSLEHLRQRQETLSRRRAEIVGQLR